MTVEPNRKPLSPHPEVTPWSLDSIDAQCIAHLVDRLTTGKPASDGAGLVVWITGLSGAGKTTVTERLAPLFQEAGRSCAVLDGDGLRELLRSDLGLTPGHDREQRLLLARLYGRLCYAVADRGHDVLCATVSMFHDAREWNRSRIPNYLEVYLRVPLDELRRRDPKGLYARSSVGEIAGMVGAGILAEEPNNADLVIDHHPGRTPDNAVQEIWQKIRERLQVATCQAPTSLPSTLSKRIP